MVFTILHNFIMLSHHIQKGTVKKKKKNHKIVSTTNKYTFCVPVYVYHEVFSLKQAGVL